MGVKSSKMHRITVKVIGKLVSEYLVNLGLAHESKFCIEAGFSLKEIRSSWGAKD